MNLIFLGPPGAGKGTQAKKILARYGIPQISTGEIFRAAMKAGTTMGLQAKLFIDKGELVPDAVVVGIVAQRLAAADCDPGFLLDGFPRTLPQAEALDGVLARLGKTLDAVAALIVPDEDLMGRLTGRRVCRACGAEFHVAFKPTKMAGLCDLCGGEVYQRSDDNETSIATRLAEYHRQTKPLLDYYAPRGLLREVDGVGTFDDVTARLTAALSV